MMVVKAIVVREFGGPERLRLEDVENPKPGPGEGLVKLEAIGVNPVETYLRSGNYTRRPELPWTPGTDGAGVVVEAGAGFPHAPGARVYLFGGRPGTYAQLCAVHASRAFALPGSLTFEQGAALGVPYGTAHRALFHHGGGKKGETVLVHGATGGVGVAAVQLARAAGLRVIGTGGGPEGVSFLKELGVDAALDHRGNFYLDEAVAFCGGRGPELIVEMLANVNLPEDMRVAAPRGRIVIIGSRGRVEIEPRAAMTKDLSVLGMSLSNLTDAERGELHGELGRLLAGGKVSPVIGRRFPLENAAAAHAAVMESGARGKIVLIP